MEDLQNYYFAGFIYILFVGVPWLIIFVERSFVDKYFDKTFSNAWSIIYIIVVILVYFSGHLDNIIRELSNFYGASGFLFGTMLGVIIFSLILTYIYTLIKIPLIWLHNLTNKKNDE